MKTKTKESNKEPIVTAQGGVPSVVKDKEKETVKKDFFPTYGKSLFQAKDADVDSMLAEYGLNWNVVKRQAGFIDENGKFVPFPDHYFTVREDIQLPLGICNEGYTIGQNTDLINIVRPIIEKEDLKIAFAGSLRESRLVYVGLEMPEHYEINGDEMKSFIVAGTSHDRSKKTFFGVTNTRIICENTFNMVNDEVSIKISHTKNREQALEKAADVLGLTNKLQRELVNIFGIFAKKDVNSATVKKIINHTLSINSKEEISTRKSNLSKILHESIERSMDESKACRGNLWGTFNGVTAYYNHCGHDESDPNYRIEYIMMGGGNSAMQRSFEFHKQLAGISLSLH